tara:strand:- start:1894 stop:2424 length:531 start_codon:yes stop_codon:yes gene_type:complete
MARSCKIEVTAGLIPSPASLFGDRRAFNLRNKRLYFDVDFTVKCTGKCPVEQKCPDDVTEIVPCSVSLRGFLASPFSDKLKDLWRFSKQPGVNGSTPMGNGKTLGENWKDAIDEIVNNPIAAGMIAAAIADAVEKERAAVEAAANCDCEAVSGVANTETRQGIRAHVKRSVKSRYY